MSHIDISLFMHIWAPEQLTELILYPTFEALQRNYAFARQHIILRSSKLFACQFSSAETLPRCIFALSGEPLVCHLQEESVSFHAWWAPPVAWCCVLAPIHFGVAPLNSFVTWSIALLLPQLGWKLIWITRMVSNKSALKLNNMHHCISAIFDMSICPISCFRAYILFLACVCVTLDDWLFL